MPDGETCSILAEELMLLGEAHALVAQMIHHPVVDADQLVHFRLADLAEARREFMLAQQLRTFARQRERAENVAGEREAGGERDREDYFDREQPQPVLPQQHNRQPREQRVQDEQTTIRRQRRLTERILPVSAPNRPLAH